MRSLISILLLAAALGACGAPPESRVALSEPGAAGHDTRLVGRWYLADGKQAYYLQVTPRDDGDGLDVVAVGVGYKDPPPVRWFGATAYASIVDGETYYNLRRTPGAGFDYTAEGETPGFIILSAELRAADELTLCFFGGFRGGKLDKLAEQDRVAARKVEGHAMGESVDYMVLDRPRAELVALIGETPRDALFGCNDDHPFRRLPPSDRGPD